MRLTSSRSSNLTEFTSLMHRMLRAAWGADWGTFCEAFPNGKDPQNVKVPVITYFVKSKRPGAVSRDGTREIKPRHREFYPTPKSINSSADAVNVYAQWFDHEIVFEVWEETNTALNELAERFEDFIMTYAGYFKSQGVGEIIFDRMVSGHESYKWRDNLVCKHYTYFLRLEKQVVVPTNVIKEIIGKVEVYDDLPSDSNQNKESINFESNKGGN